MKTILTIDDDKWVVEILRDALVARGYEVLSAVSVEEGLDILRQRPVDLLLLDLHLPGMNGFALYNKCEALQRVPVLFVTGCSRSFNPDTDGFTSVWNEGFMEGTTDILYKPFPISLLYEKVEALVGESETAANGQTH
jgi:DNA-binding response OmpR family regulator